MTPGLELLPGVVVVTITVVGVVLMLIPAAAAIAWSDEAGRIVPRRPW